ncbi:MAG: hypothetical protein C4522_16055 [Desulfobacteraceae bacterium]|nr:MAG: hypothetical protein C4522_16055 [Desulfobacteraceae bacterium]
MSFCIICVVQPYYSSLSSSIANFPELQDKTWGITCPEIRITFDTRDGIPYYTLTGFQPAISYGQQATATSGQGKKPD